jgi:D-ornithine 4,5-aminomutase subunit alpha
MKRADDFEARRAHLRNLTDDQLHARFWALTDQLTSSLLQAGRENTSPAIERSVLLRMGFSSLEAKAIVDFCLDRGLLQHGAGHVVLRLSREKGLPLREAGLALCRGELSDDAARLFEEGIA